MISVNVCVWLLLVFFNNSIFSPSTSIQHNNIICNIKTVWESKKKRKKYNENEINEKSHKLHPIAKIATQPNCAVTGNERKQIEPTRCYD